ncbi:MAG: hypothetical protein PVG51_05045 [Desulfosarcina sp.]|jgi:hypothetical protein
MDSPLVRVILATFGGYLFILLSLCVYDWFMEAFPTRPSQPPSASRIQHPIHHREAVGALEVFARLPKVEQTAIKENLESNLISLGQWITQFNRSDCQILCIGELHEEPTRNFLADAFFTKVKADTLLLEATPEKLERCIKRMEAGREYYPLLQADIMRPLRAAIKRNPDIQISGIEETDEQQKDSGGLSNSRDRHIARNFWDSFQPGKRNIILFGALHCKNESNWLFQNLHNQAPLPLKDRMLNIVVLGEHQKGPLEAFVYFLDEIGIEKRYFVIPGSSQLHPRVCEFFQLLRRQTLDKYRFVIVFRG